ncbi:hypothetical protein KPMX200_70906 [Klebsiella pneumoniae]|nr:hypothetical protein KPMX200_70906 [Klebsiella pneumoniae]
MRRNGIAHIILTIAVLNKNNLQRFYHMLNS